MEEDLPTAVARAAMSRRSTIALVALGAAVGLTIGWIDRHHGLVSGFGGRPMLLVLRTVGIGWTFMAVGILAWSIRPRNGMGRLLTAAGFAWFIPGLSNVGIPVLLGVSLWLGFLHYAIEFHLIMALPNGRLGSSLDRVVVGATYVLTVGLRFFIIAGENPRAGCPPCTANGFLLYRNPDLHDMLVAVSNRVQFAVIVLALGLLGLRWIKASRSSRRAWALAWLSGALFLAYLAFFTGPVDVFRYVHFSGRGFDDLLNGLEVAQVLVPLMFLVGLARTGLSRGGLGQLVVELGNAPAAGGLKDALARTLRDPSLEVAFWLPESGRYVDGEGRPVELPSPESGRVITVLERDGERLAALVHDEMTAQKRGLVEAVSTVAAMALENERLHAEVKVKLDEVRASRARIVEAGDEERRRVERDLHDGAQQRLVTLSLGLRMAQEQLGSTPDPAVVATLNESAMEVKLALTELRELARGIHPAILTEQGLGAALRSLAERSLVPATVTGVPADRLPASVEATAYFVVSEALANATKYARASSVMICASVQDGHVMVEVADDGVGGADVTSGSGLRGLTDRVAAVDGRLIVYSPAGHGTRVVADIPCA
jgi:signal transduction histidine kinase